MSYKVNKQLLISIEILLKELLSGKISANLQRNDLE